MIDINGQAGQTSSDQYKNSRSIDIDLIVATVITSRIFKSFQSKDGKISRSTTMSTRTIARSNKSGSANIHSLNLAGMDSSTMVAPRSGSGPSINSFIAHQNTHGVFGINAFNTLPTHSNLIEWISDSNSLIKEFDSWSMQNQVGQSYGECTPNGACKAGVPSTAQETLNNQRNDYQVNDQRGKDTATWSKNLDVVHGAILSQKKETTHV